MGDTYEVAERPLEELIAEQVQSSDMEQKLLNYTKSFEAGIEVPEAAADREYAYTPWYTLKEPIRDQNNQTLFPKGFRFNPLTKVRAPGRLVFFNESQIDWVASNVRDGDHLVMTSGDVYSAMMTLNRRVFLLDAKTHERMKLTAVPSIYEQRPDDVHFTVNEYAL
ncbi:hypothetical protein BFV93_4820 [Alteromonas macleodii]|nr:hypothetical protein BFV93_4820 [Alteromonas macleodii]